MTPGSDLPARRSSIDRAALERVLARASELQGGAADDTGDALTEEQLVSLGEEVGLSRDHLQRALAEERVRVTVPRANDTGISARLFGGAGAAASRVVRGSPADTLASLDAWMQREECLLVKRRHAEGISWEPRSGLVGAVRRGLNIGGRGFPLTRAHDVTATVVPSGAGTLVHLSADLVASRRRASRGAAGATAFGAASSAAAVALGVMIPIAVVPMVALAGIGLYGGRGTHARNVARAQLALDQILDRLEHGEIRRPVTSALLDLLPAVRPRQLP